ncbi:MAG TPA: FAD-dependent oxidoreductase [Accumulibacter sp.]|uniref:Mercuric reductase n=1 Tax=Candidatus Accumulibacter cognatus TaxID=2954383 RepID=A0A080M8V2_9PROT|nr:MULTISPECIES: bifunctional TVP38/TMEM64 family protein/FAD-dependent oxidoreductase [Candidatus Accumulibacter]MCC2868260.1 FAD-dependent oxidoreductase [Candidatus Accumulibacter phosphatis]KFB77712.1 MAG: Mercuric reductase [Candidatus Accumulibacter cognatus]MBL8399768.1 FAD-dependent oxidoreductase [Accumulibacter sp.]MBN8517417.1 FAD-dependent oxidoreductase [Accumulibacter sp.]MBO3710649.1 FAD-dependent oxidoreductase [Accumulibacter sp.]
MNKKKIVIFALIALAIVAYFQFGLGQYLNLDALKAQQAALDDYHRQHPWQVAGLYFVAYVAVTALSLPGALPMTLAGGAIFGLLWGTVIVSFASSIGATLAFLAARFLLRDWVGERFGERLKAVDEGIRRDGAFYLFTLRLIPVFPFFLVNLLLALTAMKARTFYGVSQIGMLAGTVVYVNAGTQLARIDSLAGIVSPALLASFALLGIFPLIARKVVEGVKARRVYAGWQKPARFDRNLVVIGAGSAGLVTAYIAAAVKAKVTLIEKHRMGGDCLNTGCVPSKALIRSAKLLSHIARAREFGIASAQASFDFAEVMERVQKIIKTVEPHDSVERYRELGVEVVEGSARIVSPWQVEVICHDGTMQTLRTRSIVIAAGAHPFVPPMPGIEEMGYLTSDTVWNLRQLPRRLLVLGGGPIGSELTQTFARLGARVTQVERGPRIMPREDPEVSAMVAERFRAEGVQVLLNHQAKAFVIEQGEKILIAEHEGKELRIAFDVLLVALGRSANLTGYGLEELGIPSGRTVEINEFLQTRYPNIYAAGDVAGPFQFTHTAAHQAWYAAVNALFAPFRKFRADYSVIPWSTFVEPEVARVGINEQEAQDRGIAYEVARYDIDDLDRAIADGEAHGFIKVLTVPGKDRILGVTIVGEHAGDLIAEYVLAMKQGIGLNQILGTIHIYPTLAEANKYVAGVWKKAHAPATLLRWVERFHAWRRGG